LLRTIDSGLVPAFGITFNQFIVDDEYPVVIHTGPIGMYEKIESKVKEVIPLEKLTMWYSYFESNEWGGMAFLKAANARLIL
jgi:flavorubredoxin